LDIGNLLQVKSGDLTPAQQQALRYVASHLEEAVFLTASGLARRAGVSEATVVRLAQALGVDGYPASTVIPPCVDGSVRSSGIASPPWSEWSTQLQWEGRKGMCCCGSCGRISRISRGH